MALVDNDTEFRCKDCRGEVKVLGKTSKAGTPAYVEHKRTEDGEYCVSGCGLQAGDGWAGEPLVGEAGRLSFGVSSRGVEFRVFRGKGLAYAQYIGKNRWAQHKHENGGGCDGS